MANIDLTTGIFPIAQLPADAKAYAITLAELTTLGAADFKAFYYYEGLIVFCVENQLRYQWREELTVGETGGLVGASYTYPANAIANGIDYSGRTFNFFLYQITAAEVSDFQENVTNNINVVRNSSYVNIHLDEDVMLDGDAVLVDIVTREFWVRADSYIINSTPYSATAAQHFLDPFPGVGDKRYDIFFADINGVVGVIKGLEAPIPVFPTLNPDEQIQITFVELDENGFVGISEELVYDENLGFSSEYAVTENTAGARFDLASPNDPQSNAVSIEATNTIDGDLLTFTAENITSVIGISSLYMRLKLKEAGLAVFRIRFWNGTTLVGGLRLALRPQHGFDRDNITDHQIINIPVTDIRFRGPEFTHFTIVCNALGIANTHLGFFLDKIRIISGADGIGAAGTSTWLGLTDVFETSYAGRAGWGKAVNAAQTGWNFERFPLFSDLFSSTQNINGGVIPLTNISIYDFQIWSSLYRIANVTYPQAPFLGEVRGDVTISVADATLDRFVVFYIENNGVDAPTVGFVEGAAAVNPLIPFDQLDLSIQVLIGTVRVTSLAGATPGPDVIVTSIYAEALGEPPEWDYVNGIAGSDIADTTIAYAGTKSILIPAGSPVGILKFNTAFPIKYISTGRLNWAVKLDTPMASGGSQGPGGTATVWKISLRDSTISTNTLHAIPFTLANAGLDLNNTTDWQLLSLSLDNYNIDALHPNFNIDEVWFEFLNTPKVNFDNIELVTGLNISGGVVPEYTLSPVSGNKFSLLRNGVPVPNEVTLISSTGLEAINEGNGIGWRLIGKDPLNYGNIGLGAIDFAENYAPSAVFGARAEASFNHASDTIIDPAAYGAVSFGYLNVIGTNGNPSWDGVWGVALGQQITLQDYAMFSFGVNNRLWGDPVSGSGYSAAFGRNHDFDLVGGFVAGLALIGQGVGVTVLGQANVDFNGNTNIPNEAGKLQMVIGNGTLNAGSLTASVRSDSWRLYYSGVAELPSSTIALINTLGAKAILTLEYADANYIRTNLQAELATRAALASDVNKILIASGAGTTTYTINDPFTNGDVVEFVNVGTGNLVFAAGTGTLNAPEGVILGPNRVATLMKRTFNSQYYLFGEVT